MTERLDHLIDLLRLFGEARREGYTEEAEDLGNIVSEVSLEIFPFLEENPFPTTRCWQDDFLCTLDFDKIMVTHVEYNNGRLLFRGEDNRPLCSISLNGIYYHAKNIESRMLQP